MAGVYISKSRLNTLSEEAQKLLAGVMEREEYEKDAILSKENEIQKKAFLIESGSIGCFKMNPETSSFVLMDELSSGMTSGFHHLAEKDPCFSQLQVTSSVAVVWSVTSENFISLLKQEVFLTSWLKYVHLQVRNQSKVLRAIQQNGSGKRDGKFTVSFFDSTAWTYAAFDKEEYTEKFNFKFFHQHLDEESALLAAGSNAVCAFVNDDLGENVLRILESLGIKMIALRCAGFDKVNIAHAEIYGMTVARVPAYSPYAVAEHAIALLLSINRKTHRAYQRTRDINFNLQGFIGFDLHGKNAGVIGTGMIGRCLISILLGFGCNIYCYDIYPNAELKKNPKIQYVELDELYAKADFISLHAPSTEQTRYMICEESISKMKPGVIIVNTSRGNLIKTNDLLAGLQNGRVGGAGLDVYEGEASYFFKDNSEAVIADKTLQELVTHPNVLVTGHQAFLTEDAISNIARTTVENLNSFIAGNTTSKHPNSIYK